MICILILGGFLYLSIDRQNVLTELKMDIPKLARSLKELQEEEIRLSFEIERLESPDRLIRILREKEYAHLKYPYLDEVVSIERDGE